jgi:hypothetical protein
MDKEAVEIFESLADEKITADEAVTELVELGYDRADAEELVYIPGGRERRNRMTGWISQTAKGYRSPDGCREFFLAAT